LPWVKGRYRLWGFETVKWVDGEQYFGRAGGRHPKRKMSTGPSTRRNLVRGEPDEGFDRGGLKVDEIVGRE